MKRNKVMALILCFCLMLSVTACGSDGAKNETSSNKAASGQAAENQKVSDVDGPALKDL